MGPVLDHRLDKRIDPPSSQIQRQLQTEEMGFSSTRQHRSVHDPIGRPQRRARRRENSLLDPELGNVLVSNLDVLADSQCAPEYAEDVDDQKAVSPFLDVQVETRKNKHPC